MKELSIEEKAKAYDEAIERARGEYAKFEGMLPGDVLEDVFPELKESIDERIKKVIKQVLYESTTEKDECYLDNGVTQQEVFAWLEKQGEQTIKHFELKAGHWYICHRAFCCRADHLTVKEGERFMCEKDGVVKGFVFKEPEKYFKEVCASAPIEDEQKPASAWSEEDKLKFYDILALLRGGENCHYNTPDLFDWLKSLKDRVGHFDDGYKVGFSAAKYNQWKPSEEQLNVLNEVLNFSANHESPHWNDYIFGTLNNLIRQLKKLKG